MKTSKRIMMMTLALALAIFTVGCSFSFSTAKIEDAIMTDSVDEEGKPGNTVTSFPADTAMLYTSAKIRNAPDNTKIRIVWTYVTGDQPIDEITLDSGEISDRYIYSNLAPTAILPEGDYQVEYFIEDRTEPDATVKFSVTAAENVTSANFTLFSQTEGGFSFQYPSDWVLQDFPENQGAMIYPVEYAIADETDINTAFVYADKGTAAGYTSETLLQAWMDETEAGAIENYAFVAKGIDTINGKEIVSYSYSWTRGEYALYTTDVLILNGDDLYVASLTATQDAYATIYPLFEQMAISLEIL